MKRTAVNTVVFIGERRVARSDSGLAFRAAQRPVAASPADALRSALALGDRVRGAVWVLCEEAYTQRVALSPAQVAGLSPEQLQRALAFEVEPFSGIPAAESVTGFNAAAGGAFEVVKMSRADRDGIVRAITDAGGKLAGIAHPGAVPRDEEALREWLVSLLPRLQGGALPIITPPAPPPSAHRFLFAGLALEAAALIVLLANAGWNASERKTLERRNAEFAAASRELDAANQQIAALKTELATIKKEQAHREEVASRRGALAALLQGLAALRLEDVVVRGIQAEGASSLVLSGLSVEAGSVDEMCILLTQGLRGAGWSAQPRHKTGRKALASGGPWEFSLTLTHGEAARATALQLSQRGGAGE